MSDTTTTPAPEPVDTYEDTRVGTALTAPYRPWRDRKVWIASAAALVLAAAAALTALFAFAGPSGRLAADGYKVTMQLDHVQIKQMAGSDSDSQLAVKMVDSLAYGTKGTKAEAVLQLTPAGQKLLDNPLISGLLTGAAGKGMTVNVDGGELVVTGPASQMNASNPLGSLGG